MPTIQAPSPQYGAGVAQQRQMAALPMGPPPTPQPAGPAQAPQPAPVVGLDAPTMRPDEHVMAGSPLGAGPGPEALGPLGQPAPNPLVAGVGLLAALGDNVPDQIKQLRSAVIAANANSAAP